MILATLSRKGGVGKTTTTLNLAAALAEAGLRVLLVDLDPQGSASLSLGVDRAEFSPSIGDVLDGRAHAAEVLRPSPVENLDLITASVDLIEADHMLGRFRRREQRLADALEPLRSSYDAIFIDCPPSMGLLAINALVASDAYLLPAVPHFLALEGVSNVLAAADRTAQRNGTRIRLAGILLTMVDYRTRLTRENVEAMRERYGDKVFAIEIRTNIRLAEAPGYGQTIFQYAPDSTGARAYRLLGDELMLRLDMSRRRDGEAEAASEPAAVETAPAVAEPTPPAPSPTLPSSPVTPPLTAEAPRQTDSTREAEREELEEPVGASTGAREPDAKEDVAVSDWLTWPLSTH